MEQNGLIMEVSLEYIYITGAEYFYVVAVIITTIIQCYWLAYCIWRAFGVKTI